MPKLCEFVQTMKFQHNFYVTLEINTKTMWICTPVSPTPRVCIHFEQLLGPPLRQSPRQRLVDWRWGQWWRRRKTVGEEAGDVERQSGTVARDGRQTWRTKLVAHEGRNEGQLVANMMHGLTAASHMMDKNDTREVYRGQRIWPPEEETYSYASLGFWRGIGRHVTSQYIEKVGPFLANKERFWSKALSAFD